MLRCLSMCDRYNSTFRLLKLQNSVGLDSLSRCRFTNAENVLIQLTMARSAFPRMHRSACGSSVGYLAKLACFVVRLKCHRFVFNTQERKLKPCHLHFWTCGETYQACRCHRSRQIHVLYSSVSVQLVTWVEHIFTIEIVIAKKSHKLAHLTMRKKRQLLA